MSGASSIEWTDATWNPVRGCSRVSEGCRHCYAEKFAARFAKPKGDDAPAKSPAGGYYGFVENTVAGQRWTGKVELIPSALDWPLRKQKPLRIFVNSMSDLFHEKLSNESIAAVFGVMAACPQHTFQILTKRPERMREWFQWLDRADAKDDDERWTCTIVEEAEDVIGIDEYGEALVRNAGGVINGWPLPNVWLGVSVEDQATADERIPHLLATPAAKRFVSYEPALGPVDFSDLPAASGIGRGLDALSNAGVDPGALIPYRLDWIIVGGESGPGARPFDIAWARSTVEQCKSAGVAVFVKQLGARPGYPKAEGVIERLPGPDAVCLEDAGDGWFCWRLRDRKGGDWNEWPEDLRVREFPT